MTPFWWGVLVFLITSFLSMMHSLVTLRGLRERARSFWYWLPANLSLAYFSGAVWTLISHPENQLGVGLASGFLILLNVLLAIILDARLSVIGVAQRSGDIHGMRKWAVLIFGFGAAATAILYSLYAEVDSAQLAGLWVLAALIGASFLPIWNLLRQAELSDSRRRIERLLDFQCVDAEALQAEPGDAFWQTASPIGLAHALECVERSLDQVQSFRSMRRERLVPGLSCNQVCKEEISSLTEEVRKTYLNRLTERRHCIRLLLGNEAIAEDSAHALRRFCDKSALTDLEARRVKLMLEPSWEGHSLRDS